MAQDGPRHDVGVLFVHGIGGQRQGATLLSGGEALHEWLALWITGGKRAKGAWGAEIFPQTHGEDEPAHAGMTITSYVDEDTPPVEHNLLLAESWWAEEFITPGFRQLMMWAFWVVPWLLTEHFGRQVLRRRLRTRAAAGRWRKVVFFTQLAWRMVLLAASYAAMAPLVVVVLALGIIGSIPINVIRRSVLAIQRTLTSGVGDSFVLLTSPIQEAAILEHVRRDLEWLASDAKKVVIVAHSQGAAVVHRLLRGIRSEGRLQAEISPVPSNVEVLISLGSGVHKLEELDASRDRAQNRQASVLPVEATPYYGLVGFWIVVGGLLSDGSVVSMMILSVIGGGMLLVSMWRAAHQTAEFRDLMVDRRFQWLDLYAARDPVPNGAIMEVGRRVEYAEDLIYEYLAHGGPQTHTRIPHSFSISNRRSLIGDHVGYWANNEEVMTSIALAVGSHGPSRTSFPRIGTAGRSSSPDREGVSSA